MRPGSMQAAQTPWPVRVTKESKAGWLGMHLPGGDQGLHFGHTGLHFVRLVGPEHDRFSIEVDGLPLILQL